MATEDSKHQRDILEQLFIKRDDVERIYSNEKGAGLVLSKRIKKEELEKNLYSKNVITRLHFII